MFFLTKVKGIFWAVYFCEVCGEFYLVKGKDLRKVEKKVETIVLEDFKKDSEVKCGSRGFKGYKKA